MVAARSDPSPERDFAPGVGGAQRAAIVRARPRRQRRIFVRGGHQITSVEEYLRRAAYGIVTKCGRRSRGDKRVDQIVLRDLALRAGLQIAQRGAPARKFVVADNHRVARTDPVGASQQRLEPASGREQLDAQSCRAHLSRELHPAAHRGVAQGDQRRVGARVEAGRVQRQREAIDADREAGPRNRRAAQSLDQAVVAAARRHCALRADRGRDDLEGGARIVVQAAHQARIDHVRHAGVR